MIDFTHIIKGLEEWKTRLPDVAIYTAEQNKEAAIDLITENQLSKGRDGNNAEITPKYRPMTIAIKKAKGQPTDRVTLYDEGDFHRSLEFEKLNHSFRIIGTDGKTGKLLRKYGEQVLKLNADSLFEFNDEIRDELKRNAQAALII